MSETEVGDEWKPTWNVVRHSGWGGSLSPMPKTVLRGLTRAEAVQAATELARTAPSATSFEVKAATP